MDRCSYQIYAIILSFFSVFFLADVCQAQQEKVEYGIETSAYLGLSEKLPFWLYANTDGTVDASSSNFINRFYSTYSVSNSSEELQFRSGLNMNGRISQQNSLFFTQLFGELRYKGVALKGGRFYDPIGLNDRELSMGSMMVSRNATPVPKVRLGTAGFVKIPGTRERLELDMMMSHGWFTDDRHIDGPYLHQKYFYLKYNHPRFDLTAGAVHNVTWGGTHPRFGDLPSSFSDFLRVASGRAAIGDNAPANDTSNVIGNSVAAYDFKAGINFDQFRLKIYRLFYLEDKVALRFRSPWDGMWGAGIEFDDQEGIVTALLWEHMNTKRQNSWIGDPLGRSGYYHNGVYRSGWSYEGRVLGNPLLLIGPNEHFEGRGEISNNMIVAHHIGLQGKPLNRLRYKAFFTYSRNYGTVIMQGEDPPYTPLEELRIDQHSVLLSGSYKLIPEHGVSAIAALAADIGELYSGNRWGMQIGLKMDFGN